MGVRIIIWVASIFLVTSCKVFLNGDKRDSLQYLKDIAFCTCLNENYNSIDSSFSSIFQDVSKSSIFMQANIDVEIEDLVTKYTIKETGNYYQLKNHTTSELGNKSNYIMAACLNFYNSKKLEKFIIGIIQ